MRVGRVARWRGSGPLTGLQPAEQRPHLNVRALAGGDLGKGAGGLGLDLDGDLVGLQLHKRLVERDRIARRLVPAHDGGFGDRFAESGDGDVEGHDPPFPSSASSISARCSRWCTTRKPVAGEAAAARPT